jgi:serine/threonine protein phosphatase PrpC
MIDCKQCGFENPDRNKFCQNCGSNLVSVIASNKNMTGASTTFQVNPAAQIQSEPTSWQDSADEIDEIDEIDELSVINHSDVISETVGNAISEESLGEDEIAEITESNIEPDLELDLESSLDNVTNQDNSIDLDVQISSAPQLPVIAKAEASKEIDIKPQLARLISLRHAGLTDVGKQRNHNEDNFEISSQIATNETPDQGALIISRGLFVLCDGMGGHAGGEVASSMAIEKIVEQFRPFWRDKLPGSKKMREIILTANQAIFEQNEIELRRDVGRMGTTLALLSIFNSEVAIAHVGDSRIYQITASGLKQITRDHEVANRLIDQGVETAVALSRHDAHQLTQALGPYANHQLEPAIAFAQITEPTLFLLCSDGLCDNDLVERNWETYLLPLLAADADLGAGAKKLIDLANTINGHDNITAILVNCQVESISQLGS